MDKCQASYLKQVLYEMMLHDEYTGTDKCNGMIVQCKGSTSIFSYGSLHKLAKETYGWKVNLGLMAAAVIDCVNPKFLNTDVLWNQE